MQCHALQMLHRSNLKHHTDPLENNFEFVYPSVGWRRAGGTPDLRWPSSLYDKRQSLQSHLSRAHCVFVSAENCYQYKRPKVLNERLSDSVMIRETAAKGPSTVAQQTFFDCVTVHDRDTNI